MNVVGRQPHLHVIAPGSSVSHARAQLPCRNCHDYQGLRGKQVTMVRLVLFRIWRVTSWLVVTPSDDLASTAPSLLEPRSPQGSAVAAPHVTGLASLALLPCLCTLLPLLTTRKNAGVLVPCFYTSAHVPLGLIIPNPGYYPLHGNQNYDMLGQVTCCVER